jgi:hypothetical protein
MTEELDNIFTDVVEEIKQEEVTVEPEVTNSWQHVLFLRLQNPRGFDFYGNIDKTVVIENAKKLRQILKYLGFHVSDIIQSEYATYSKNANNTFIIQNEYYTRVLPGEIAFIGFSGNPPSFLSLYRIGEYLEKNQNLYSEIDLMPVSPEVLYCYITNKTHEDYQMHLAVAFDREIDYCHYSQKVIRKIAELNAYGEYKCLNCFDVFEDCRLRDFASESADKNDDSAFEHVLLWCATIHEMRIIEEQGDSLLPQMFKLTTLSCKRIVRSEIVIYASVVLCILELEREHRDDNVATYYMTLCFDSYDSMKDSISRYIEDDSEQICDIIKNEVYYLTYNPSFA